MGTNTAQAIRHRLGITTETLAERLALRPQTLRASLCRHGHYYGLKPHKLPNGRLLWPDDSVAQLTGEAQ